MVHTAKITIQSLMNWQESMTKRKQPLSLHLITKYRCKKLIIRGTLVPSVKESIFCCQSNYKILTCKASNLTQNSYRSSGGLMGQMSAFSLNIRAGNSFPSAHCD